MPCIDTVQGFSFCPAAYQLHTRVYSGFSNVHAIIPQQRQNRLQGFTAAFPLILPIPAHTMQQPHKQTIHRLRHVGGHTLKRSTFTDTRYHRHAGRCISQHSRPIIIMYIRGCRCALLWINARRCSISQTMQARRGQRLHLYRVSPAVCDLAPVSSQGAPSTRRDSPAAGARRAARNHWRLPPHLFSGFRPIANRGQQ